MSGTSDSKMFAIGERLPGLPYVMKCDSISQKDTSTLASTIEHLIRSEYYNCLENIRKHENLISQNARNLHCLGKYSRTFDMSYNLSNPAHVDSGDITSGVSIWLRKQLHHRESDNDNWWFVLPNLRTCDKDMKGIAIKLSHGLCIEWDGRIIKHCSSVPNVPEDDSFIGAFFSAKKKFL